MQNVEALSYRPQLCPPYDVLNKQSQMLLPLPEQLSSNRQIDPLIVKK